MSLNEPPQAARLVSDTGAPRGSQRWGRHQSRGGQATCGGPYRSSPHGASAMRGRSSLRSPDRSETHGELGVDERGPSVETRVVAREIEAQSTYRPFWPSVAHLRLTIGRKPSVVAGEFIRAAASRRPPGRSSRDAWPSPRICLWFSAVFISGGPYRCGGFIAFYIGHESQTTPYPHRRSCSCA